MVLVQGLVEKWQFPFFCDMDCKVTSELHMQFICELEDVEVRVMASTCDQGGSNYGLKTTLGLTEDAPWVQNPRRPDSFVFFLFDWVHVHKNLRNNLLDHTLVLEDGMRIDAKKLLQRLFKHCKDNEIGSASFLKDILLECKSSDRQKVSFSETVMSEKMANLMRLVYPNDAKVLRLADIFDQIHKGCHIHIFKVLRFLLTRTLSYTQATVFKNHRKSTIQQCERSELRLHFEWTKVH